MFDHFQAVVRTICARLRSDAGGEPTMGGSTYSFDVWPGHPFESEVMGLLGKLREQTSALRSKVRAYNDAEGRPAEYLHVTFYGGQCVIHEDDPSEM